MAVALAVEKWLALTGAVMQAGMFAFLAGGGSGVHLHWLWR